jgi:hypothetical protein
VVNPLGVAKPMVGWKRAPLLASCIIPGVISDKCFASGILKYIYIYIYIYIYMFILMIMPISCETVNEFIVRMSVGCFDQY